MPSLNFQKQFVPLIESGEKRQTIRLKRKNPIKVGDNLYLFTGLRTKNCKNIITPYSRPYNSRKTGKHSEYVICKSVEKIKIEENLICLYSDKYLCGFHYLSTIETKRFIDDDGFKGDDFNKFNKWKDFFNFFKTQYGLPFEGVLIKW